MTCPLLWLELEPAGWFPVIRRARSIYQNIVSCSTTFAQLPEWLFVVCLIAIADRGNPSMARWATPVPQNSSADARAVPLGKFCEIFMSHIFDPPDIARKVETYGSLLPALV